MGVSASIVQWVCPLALYSGCVHWHFAVGVSTGVVQWVCPLVLCSRCVHALSSPATSPRHLFCLALTTPTLWFWTYHTCAEAMTCLAHTAINDYVIAQWVCMLELMTLSSLCLSPVGTPPPDQRNWRPPPPPPPPTPSSSLPHIPGEQSYTLQPGPPNQGLL